MLHHVDRVDRILLWLNLAPLMAVTFISYPAALAGTAHVGENAARWYGITL